MEKYPLIARVPDIWRRLDRDDVSRKLFGVFDDEYDYAASLVEQYLEFQDVDKCPDKYLPLLGVLVGHEWRESQSFLWNRNRIRFALKRASYKGTTLSIEDLLIEHGAGAWTITDMASRLDIWNRQGGWNRLDGVCVGDGVYHPGCYQLEVDNNIDFDAFLEDFELIRPAGTVWYFIRDAESANIIDDSLATDCLDIDAYSPALPTLDDIMVWSPSGSPTASNLEGSTFHAGVDGGLMFTTSSIPIDTQGLFVTMGDDNNPLPIEIAIIQDCSELIEGT
jgi:hypothetical protein